MTFEVIATYDYPGFEETFANKINDAGDVVGTVRDGAGHSYGYIRNADGHVSNLISFPGTTFTGVLGINNLRQVWERPRVGGASEGRVYTFDIQSVASPTS